MRNYGEISKVADLLEDFNMLGQVAKPNGEGRALFRGQNCNDKLLPSVARKVGARNNTEREQQMLNELKLRGALVVNQTHDNDWELLAFAQHNNMATRLLDWSSNPLVALWFAIEDRRCLTKPSYLYFFYVDREHILTDAELLGGPFTLTSVKVVRPKLNNRRIVAQHGWFTCHPFDVDLGRYLSVEDLIGESMRDTFSFNIQPEHKLDLLEGLDMLGINAQTIYPDTYGLAMQINWDYREILYDGF